MLENMSFEGLSLSCLSLLSSHCYLDLLLSWAAVVVLSGHRCNHANFNSYMSSLLKHYRVWDSLNNHFICAAHFDLPEFQNRSRLKTVGWLVGSEKIPLMAFASIATQHAAAGHVLLPYIH